MSQPGENFSGLGMLARRRKFGFNTGYMKSFPGLMSCRVYVLIATLAIGCPQAGAEPATTAPAADDAPAPAMLAPTYLAIGKDLSLRLALVRRTLDDLALDQPIRQRANQIVNDSESELQYLMTEIRAGRMPPNKRLMAVPDNLRAARDKLLEVIGPQQSQLLTEKLRSLRGEARQQISQLRLALIDVKTSAAQSHRCDSILAATEGAAEKLPDIDLNGDEYARARQSMIDLFVRAHDELAKVLTPLEQSQLGAHFAELAAKGPATQPSPGRS
jgi:hypothetical protein